MRPESLPCIRLRSAQAGADHLVRQRRQLRRSDQGARRRTRRPSSAPPASSPSPAASCCCRPPTASSPACCSASRRPTNRSRTCSGPGSLPSLLPPGTYRFANAPHDARLAALAFALGSYRFTRYRKGEARNVRLELPDGVDGEDLSRIADGGGARPRSDQHAVERHGPGRAGGGRAHARHAARRRHSTSSSATRWPRTFR